MSNAQESVFLKDINDHALRLIKSADFELAWEELERGEKLARKREYFDSLVLFLQLKATVQNEIGNNLKAVKLNLEALEITKNVKVEPTLQVSTLIKLASCYKYLNEYDRCIYYLKKAEKVVDGCASCESLRGEVLINFGATYIHKDDLDSAEFYLIDELNRLDSVHRSKKRILASSNYWLSRLYEEKEEYDKAIHHLNITMRIDSLNKNIQHYRQDQFQLAVILQGKSDYDKAIEVYKKCLENGSRNNELRLVYSCFKNLHSCYLGKGDSLHALRFLLNANEIRDSLYDINRLEEIRNLEFQHQFEIIDLKKKHELEQIKSAEEKSRLITWITIISSAIVIIILVVLGIVAWKRSRSRLMIKKKEVALYTAEISSKNEAINSAVENLNKQIVELGDNPDLRSTLNDLKFELKNEDFWKDFEVRFRDVQAKFYRSLLRKHPDLTKNEVRLCSFVKLQLTTKEIAALTKKSIGSVNVAKHRLKKKLKLPEDQTLYAYINSERFL